MITNDEVIYNRQAEIFNELQDIEQEIARLQAKKAMREAEYKMLQNIKDKGLISDSTTISRIHIEDAIKRIFDKVGRPLSIGEIIDELERFGYQWSNYHTAYYRLVKRDILEPTGARGYYQIRKF